MLTWRTLLLPLFFFFSCAVHPRDLHSFPTRRSSDLTRSGAPLGGGGGDVMVQVVRLNHASAAEMAERLEPLDRKSTRLNSSHVAISYAVFCLKKKTQTSVDKVHVIICNDVGHE